MLLLDKLKPIEDRYEEINQELLTVGDDYQKAAELSIERSDMESVVEKAKEYRQTIQQIEEAKSLLESEDAEMVELAEMELAELEPQIEVLENQIKALLLPKDPRDGKNVIVEIRAGAGGDEAGILPPTYTACIPATPNV